MKKIYLFIAFATLALFSAAIACDITRPLCKKTATYGQPAASHAVNGFTAADPYEGNFGPLQMPASL